jgi:hypothetical protein
MMERSTKFLSISGMSGVLAGIFALAGAVAAYFVAYRGWRITDLSFGTDYLIIAVTVLILAAVPGFWLSVRKARRNDSKFWTPVTRQILTDFAIPMVAGGFFCIALIWHRLGDFAQAATLLFYGLALISAGKRTYGDVRKLGTCQVVLGILAAFRPEYGLFFWAFGFGILHIFYGIVMHYRYDRMKKQESA